MRIPAWSVVLVAACSTGEQKGVHRDALEAPRVLVLFQDPGGEDAARAHAIDARRAELIAKLPRGAVVVRHAFVHVPGFAAQVRPDAIEALRALPGVLSVTADEPGEGTTAESGPLVKAPAARVQHTVTGAGVKVAVLDTGIQATHMDLAGAVTAQQCFTNGDCQPGNTNTGTNANDLNGHGTNVSGIVTGDGVLAPIGMAPGASIVAVRVLDRNNAGFTSDWVAGLDWVYTNRATLAAKVVNMSLGTSMLYTGNCDAQQGAMKAAVANLRDAGVVIFASSGNDGSNDKVRSPACVTGVVAVGATYDVGSARVPDAGTFQTRFGSSFGNCSDSNATPQTLTCFTNGGPEVDVVAPGCFITAAYIGNAIDWYCGTSQASPTVAGIAALMLQKKPGLTPDQIEATLKSTASSINDTRTGRSYPYVDALAALNDVANGGCTGKANGTACDDGNACTTADTCQANVCTGGPALSCAPNGCGNTGACNPATGCVAMGVPDGTACNDNDACTSNDACASGKCTGTAKVCPAQMGCLGASVCAPATGQCGAQAMLPSGTACNDGNACTLGDTCSAGGTCAGTAVTCGAASDCREAETCNAASGTCEAGAAKADGTSCAGFGQCQSGKCEATAQPQGFCSTGAAGPLVLALSLLTGLAARRARRSGRPDPTGRRGL